MVNCYRPILVLSAVLVLGLAAFSAGCSSTQAPSIPVTPMPAASTLVTANPVIATPAPTGGVSTVTISGFAFSPADLTVKTGTTITWTNNDPASHTIVADAGAFSSDPFAKGGTYQFTFSQPGTYAYHCSIHPSMKGTIIVQV
jgi:plastocyanin